MSTTTAKLNIDANQALAALSRVDKQIQGLGKSFGALQRLLGGIAVGAFIQNAFKMADALDDISKATGIAIQNVMGFGLAVQANGGTIDDANNALLKLTQNIGEAAAGSAEAQYAFRQVGVSLQDLATLSEQEILDKVLKGLGAIPDKAKQASLSIDLMGKGFKGLDLKGLSEDYVKAVMASAKYAQATKSAADANQNLQAIQAKLTNELLLTLKPISDLIKNIDANSESFMRWFNAIKSVVGVLFTIFTIIVPLGRAIAAARASWVAFTAALATLRNDFPRFFKDITGYVSGFKRVGEIIKAGLEKAAAGRPSKYTVEQWGKFGEVLETVKSGAAKAALTIGTLISSAAAGAIGFFTGGPTDEDVARAKALADYQKGIGKGGGPQGPRRTGKEEREVINALAKQGDEIRNVTAAYKDNQDQLIANINAEARYMTMANDTVEVIKVQQEIYEKGIEQIKELERKKASLTDKEKLLAPIIDEQIQAIQKSIIADQIRAESAIKNLQERRNAEEELRKSIQDAVRAFETDTQIQDLQDQLSLIGLTGEALERETTILQANRDMRNELVRLAEQMANLEVDRIRIGETAYSREKQRIQDQITDAYRVRDAKIQAKEDELARIEELEQSYAEGAKKALEDIAEQYKPINVAQDAIKKGWSNISNAIDTFVETGKFKFSDFARSVLQDLAKMIAKAMIFKAISAALGAFGLKIPGLAAGGPVEAGKAYMVGEKGPELFVPTGSGKIVPNDKVGSGGAGTVSAPVTNNYNTYNINALDAKSVAQVFAENRKAIFGANKMAEREMSYAGAR